MKVEFKKLIYKKSRMEYSQFAADNKLRISDFFNLHFKNHLENGLTD